MHKLSIEETWSLIKSHAGEIFHTKRGLEFTYVVRGDGFFPSRTAYRLSKADFKKALSIFPIEGPGVIRDIVRGPTYVWAVLHDQRILTKVSSV